MDFNPISIGADIVTGGASGRVDEDLARQRKALARTQESEKRFSDRGVAAEGLANQARGQQQGALDLSRQAALGAAPSAAAAQQSQALQQTQAAGFAQAAAGGGNPLAAQRQALQASNHAALQQSGQAAQLRAQEMATARGEYAAGAAGIRGADEGRMQGAAQAELGSQRNFNEGLKNSLAGEEEQAKSKAGMIASGLSLGLSDERAKTDVRSGDGAIRSMLDALAPKQFRYKPGVGEDSGEHVGVMAQDLERSKAGRAAVHNGVDGLKRIDGGEAVGPMLAALGNINGRLRRAGL